MILFLVVTLQAKNGLTQTHLTTLSPENNAQNVSADSSIEIVFDLPISKNSLRRNTIVLKKMKNKKIKGKINIKNKNTLVFTPLQEFQSDIYKVEVKRVDLLDYATDTKAKRYAKKFCSYFYDDVKECKLYRYACEIKSKKIKYSFSVDDNQPKVVSLTLNKSNIQLNEDNTTSISVNAKYDDNTTLDVTDDVEWVISNPNIISIEKNIITPKAEGETTLQAKFNNQTTTEISVTVYKEINGYKLPPKPDETLNNSTILGVDSNSNGVRDDVEIFIVKQYKNEHKIVTEIGFQLARAYQKILDNPLDTEANDVALTDAMDCNKYFKRSAKTFGDPVLIDRYIDEDFENLQLNRKSRVKAYWEFDAQLSGGVYESTTYDKLKEKCNFDVASLLGVQ